MTGTGPDVDLSNTRDSVTLRIGLLPTTLSVTKRATTQQPHAGQLTSYKIIVRDTGRTAAVGIKVCDALPPSLELRSARGGTLVGSQLCFHMFQLKTSHTRVFSVFVRVRSGVPAGPLVNRVTALALNAPQVADAATTLVG